MQGSQLLDGIDRLLKIAPEEVGHANQWGAVQWLKTKRTSLVPVQQRKSFS
jgi:hypothetical protein